LKNDTSLSFFGPLGICMADGARSDVLRKGKGRRKVLTEAARGQRCFVVRKDPLVVVEVDDKISGL